MSAPGWQADDLVNKGFIMNLREPSVSGSGGTTFIVTGLNRSGTSLVASILRRIGLFMGTEINDIVHEDETMAKVLQERDEGALKRLIAERDASYGTWGFKFPMLWTSLGHQDMALFSNPHVVVTFRDPVSVAVRNALSEYHEPMQALRAAVDELAALVAFVERLECSTMLLSYEKALLFPADFVDALMRFCGLASNSGLRDGLIRLIQPNRRKYIGQARRRYEGVVEGIADGRLHGWCRLTGVADPVMLELLVDDGPALPVIADGFRRDLLDAGFGAGHHGFAVDLAKLGLRPDQLIRIRVARHGIELENSGRRLEAYRGSGSDPC